MKIRMVNGFLMKAASTGRFAPASAAPAKPTNQEVPVNINNSVKRKQKNKDTLNG
jgi:hypothetical protein